MSKLLGHIVALIDYEVLVKDLEDLAALKICHIEAKTCMMVDALLVEAGRKETGYYQLGRKNRRNGFELEAQQIQWRMGQGYGGEASDGKQFETIFVT